MKILIAGSSGLVGTSITRKLTELGHEVSRLVRKKPDAENEIYWDPYQQVINQKETEGFDAFINLAGDNIATGRWSADKKKKIHDSRILSTKFLVQIISKLKQPPKVLVNASAIGIYGNSGSEWVKEESSPGNGFLAEVCRDWEAAAQPAEAFTRVVYLRTGVVLSKEGGALQNMMTPFKYGLGGVIGSGEQYWSWIALEDLNNVIIEIITNDSIRGPVNAVSPNPVTNSEFTEILGKALKKPTFFPFPAFLAKLVLGEMADEMLLASERVLPGKLKDSDFAFKYPQLGPFLETELAESTR